ncbi:hypothetical protein DFJ74DRAFT_662978 [Hyaloraphidium curvatum]|nr:hypothetical protein DFJ74DRAFT_662978 [Hyaloraphidium curvatum]
MPDASRGAPRTSSASYTLALSALALLAALLLRPAPPRAEMSGDAFAHFAGNLALAHKVLRRGVHQMENNAPKVGEADVPAFVGYSLAFLANLKSHHDQEEQIIFPALDKAAPGLAARHEEHGVLAGAMGNLGGYLEGVRDGKEPWDHERFAEVLWRVKKVVLPHVDAEEEDLSPADLKSGGVGPDTMAELNKAMAAHGKSQPNKTVDFAFMIAHLSADERAAFFAKAPYFVREWIFWSYTLWNWSWWRYATTSDA